jgi:hypothetical protein
LDEAKTSLKEGADCSAVFDSFSSIVDNDDEKIKEIG